MAALPPPQSVERYRRRSEGVIAEPPSPTSPTAPTEIFSTAVPSQPTEEDRPQRAVHAARGRRDALRWGRKAQRTLQRELLTHVAVVRFAALAAAAFAKWRFERALDLLRWKSQITLARWVRRLRLLLRLRFVVQRCYRGFAACTKARLLVLGVLWDKCIVAEESRLRGIRRRELKAEASKPALLPAPLGESNESNGGSNGGKKRLTLQEQRKKYDDRRLKLQSDAVEAMRQKREKSADQRADRRWGHIDGRMAQLRARLLGKVRLVDYKSADDIPPVTVDEAARLHRLSGVLRLLRAAHRRSEDAKEGVRDAPRRFSLQDAADFLNLEDERQKTASFAVVVAWPTVAFFVAPRQAGRPSATLRERVKDAVRCALDAQVAGRRALAYDDATSRDDHFASRDSLSHISQLS
ncbi:hypothetical protein M885DRAFT_569268 [Pelagophyceae sp. CCMP2097]|nr:hypothetical protein M885DRAFT_569268 [Pelagophyceae sp. CCMP2097]